VFKLFNRDDLIALIICLAIIAIIVFGTGATTNFIYAGF